MDDISRPALRRPGKRDSIAKFLAAGFPVDTVIDVGVQYGTPELIDTLGDRRHILCEPITEYHDSIARTYTGRGVDFLLDARAASDSDGTAQIALSTTSDAQTITHARLNDADAPGQTLREITTVRLSTLVADLNLMGPFLLKIDVDGAEEMILRGAGPMLKQCSGVIMEAHIESFFQRCQYLIDAGLTLFDIIDLCYYDDRLCQVDVFFINPAFAPEGAEKPISGAWDNSKWFDLIHHI
ncbi:MAG: FkbM family methyltransferase [Pseudomonadota bacterium]|nr:FkbM family methyltransferase [Pseudomonadota bacterium]